MDLGELAVMCSEGSLAGRDIFVLTSIGEA